MASAGGEGDTEEIWGFIRNRERWRERKEAHKARLRGETDSSEDVIEKRFRDATKSDQNHNDLLRSTITAFGPSSRIFDETGWRLLCAEPLYEKDPSLPNPDALIGYPDHDTVVIVECKAGLSSPQSALEQIDSAADEVEKHERYLAKKTGFKFQQIECVLCVPGELGWKAVEAIEEAESEGGQTNRILLWNLNRFENERLQLHTKFETRSTGESSHDSQLTEYLSNQGVKVAADPMMTPLFFPESHLYNVMEQCFSELLWERLGREDAIRKCTRQELYGIMNQQKNVPHYDTETIADEVCHRLMARLNEYGLIVDEDPTEEGIGSGFELYTFSSSKVEGETIDTIIKNLKIGFKQEWMDRKAEETAIQQTVEEFLKENRSFDEF